MKRLNQIFAVMLIVFSIPFITAFAKSDTEEKYCAAFVSPAGKADIPFKCFPDRESLDSDNGSSFSSQFGEVSSASSVPLFTLYDNSNFTATLIIYGPACNQYGQLSSLGFMNNRASSWFINCHGQVSGYYYDILYPSQNFSCYPIAALILSQVNDSSGTFYWPFNNTFESFKNQAQQPAGC